MRKLKIIKMSYVQHLESTINILLYRLHACLCFYTFLYLSINPSYSGDVLQSKLQASVNFPLNTSIYHSGDYDPQRRLEDL